MANLHNIKDYESAVTALSSGAATITVEVSPAYRHWFAAVEYYDSADADTVVSPTSGTETYTLKTAVLPGIYQDFSNNSVDHSSEHDEVNWESPTVEVKVVMASIAGGSATHCKVRVVGCIS